mmetsp:Transcript_32993/g.33601  ORF Transcript_32993/g.33601 Transcript_32993/m.33601 type:complete len:722 (+) Transcript_32993:270-2435(+)
MEITGNTSFSNLLSLSGKSDVVFENLLLFCGISVAAYLGSYIRLGADYYRIWKTETNYCIMYTQIVGCVIMGFVTSHKKLMSNSCYSNRINRVLYISITTGLCGSITTFSKWQIECSKNFILQWDGQSSISFATTNGGRFIEWIVSLWIGVALPLMALHLGHHLSLLSPLSNDKLCECHQTTTNQPVSALEVLLVLITILVTVLIILLTIFVYSTWEHMTYTAVFGALGAYLRYQLSKLNPHSKDFPIGTFMANISGTWLLAGITLISTFFVDYYNQSVKSVMYGVSTGFCGCLTTVSTFVNEIDTMSVYNSYRYGILSNLVAQFGIILIFGVYAYSSVPGDVIQSSSVDMCASLHNICDSVLTSVNCSSDMAVNLPCAGVPSSYYQFVGSCGCGELNLASVQSSLVSMTTRASVLELTSFVWPGELNPAQKSFKIDPTLTIDVCFSFETVCASFLTHINCPKDLYDISGCHRQGILQYEGRCDCGAYRVGKIVTDMIADVLLNYRQSSLPVLQRHAELDLPKDFGEAFVHICYQLLSYANCANKYLNIIAYDKSPNSSVWIGRCQCGKRYDVSSAAFTYLIRSIVSESDGNKLIVNRNESIYNKVIFRNKNNFCENYIVACEATLERVNCSTDMRRVRGCRSCSERDNLTLHGMICEEGDVARWQGDCSCGSTFSAHREVLEMAVDTIAYQRAANIYLYTPSKNNAYSQAISGYLFLSLQ